MEILKKRNGLLSLPAWISGTQPLRWISISLKNLFTSCISSQGNRIGPVCVSVCLCVSYIKNLCASLNPYTLRNYFYIDMGPPHPISKRNSFSFLNVHRDKNVFTSMWTESLHKIRFRAAALVRVTTCSSDTWIIPFSLFKESQLVRALDFVPTRHLFKCMHPIAQDWPLSQVISRTVVRYKVTLKQPQNKHFK